MRIFGQFNDNYFPVIDGVTIVVSNYAKWLNKKYGHCFIAAPRFPKQAEEDVNLLTFSSVMLPKRKPYRIGVPGLDMHYRKRVRSIPFDLVHAHSPFLAGHEARRIARERGIPVVATFHSKYYEDFLQYFDSERLAQIALENIIKFYESVDAVWTVNKVTAETLRSYGYSGEVTVITNGTDLVPPPNASALGDRVRADLGIPADEPFLLYVGQHTWQKNLKLLFEALGCLSAGHRSFTMVMVGEGYARDELETLAHSLGIENRVRFIGAVSDRERLESLYLAANLFVFPSVYDTSALVVQEASALGCPSVLLSGSNAAQSVVDGENGFLCADTPEALAARIGSVLSDPALAIRVGQRARETLAVSWEKIVDEVYANYLPLMEKQKAYAHIKSKKPERMRSARVKPKGLKADE